MIGRHTARRLAGIARDERGVATVFGACVIAAVVALVVAIVYLATAVAARHRAQSGADLAALAAAQRVILALDDPCGAARSLSQTSHVTITRCVTAGEDVVVHASVRVSLGPFGAHDARAAARAGPTG